MPIQIKKATTICELEELFRLRYLVFIKECRYNLPHQNQKLFDIFDNQDCTTNLIAIKDNIIIAGIRLTWLTIKNNKYLSPLYNFENLTKKINISLVLGSNFVIAKKFRNYFLCSKLLKTAHQTSQKLEFTHVAAVVSPSLEPICLKFGYQPLSKQKKIPSTGLIIRPVILELNKFKNNS